MACIASDSEKIRTREANKLQAFQLRLEFRLSNTPTAKIQRKGKPGAHLSCALLSLRDIVCPEYGLKKKGICEALLDVRAVFATRTPPPAAAATGARS